MSEPGPEGPFTIQISEYQRKLIERVLHWGETSPNLRMVLRNESGEWLENKQVELETLRRMFEELPQVNTKDMLHGF